MITAVGPEKIFPGRRLGRLPKREDPRTLQFKKYLAPAALVVPVSADFSTLVNPWPMYGNDAYGDCTCASIGHGVQLLSAMAGAGNTVTPTDAQVLQVYYDENNNGQPFAAGSPQDQGADILSVITDWKTKGLGTPPVSPYAFVEVDTSNIDEVKVAISLFGGLDTGVNLPLASQGQPAWNTIYNPANANTWSGTWGGHSIWVVKFDATGLWVVSWGELIFVTWEFWNCYFDEAYAVLPTDWQVRPDGFDFTQLEADLTELQSVA